MKIQKYSILFLFIFAGFNWAFGQTDEPLKREVEVIKEYQPSISDAKMISETPKIKDSVQATPTFKYQIKSNPIEVEKSINTIAQVDYLEAKIQELGMGYLKAGFGNGFANYAEFVLNSKPSENSDFGIFLSHDYQYAKAKLLSGVNLKTPESNQHISLFGGNSFKNQHLNWSLGYDRSAYQYYGYFVTDSAYVADYSTLFNTDEVTSQALNQFNGVVNLVNTNMRSAVDYNVNFHNNYFWNKTGQRSNYAGLDGNIVFDNSDYELGLDAKLAYRFQDSVQNIYTNLTSSRESFFELFLTPKISFEGKGWSVQAGLNMGSIYNSDTSSYVHWSPNVKLQFTPIENVLTIFAGVDGGFENNNYAQALVHNPYQSSGLSLLPTEKTFSVFGGFKGTIADKVSYVLDVDYSMYENFVQYYSTFTNYDADVVSPTSLLFFENQFQAEYIDIKALRLGGKIRYSSGNVNAQIGANFLSYESGLMTDFSYLPSFNLDFAMDVKITDQISAYLNSKVVGPQNGLVKYTDLFASIIPAPEYISIPTKIDINLGVKYDYSSNLSFFFDVQNLINQNHQEWLGYVDPGMICTIGARFTF